MENRFRGSLVALPTPFRGTEIDLDAFGELVDYHAERETTGIVVAGTTGEAATLTEREHRGLIHAAVQLARGRLDVIAGVGKNDTRRTVELARFAGACNVDGILVVTPYYNRPSRNGLMLHYDTVADATRAPIVLYNVPSRTGVDLDPELACALRRRHGNIVAIKEASGEVERVRAIQSASDLAVLCGEDACIAASVRAGSCGAISVTANVAPDAVAELVDACRPDGDAARAEELEAFLAPLVRALFVEVNPVPVKAALARLRGLSAEVRAPLAPLEEQNLARLEAALDAAGMVPVASASA